ncbi:MAG: transporter [Phocaeicola sp.]
MLNFLRNWTLPISMFVGVVSYFLLSSVDLFRPLVPALKCGVSYFIPTLIFVQLLFTFSKVHPNELKPCKWQFWLLLFQFILALLVALGLILLPWVQLHKEVFQALLICLLAPTATAAAIITNKLGGSVSSLTTYILLSNILSVVLISILFPWVEIRADVSLVSEMFRICDKVFRMLLIPFILALFLRRFVPVVHSFLLKYHGFSFYSWAVALAVVTAQTLNAMVKSHASGTVLFAIVCMGLLACVIQFTAGKMIGELYGVRINGGQALGQKNTVLAIWLATTFLNPVAALGPSSYVIWQNVFNSWQLWKKQRDENQAS